MPYAGFVLTGGQSSRMGRDKAQLVYRGDSLARYVADEVFAAAGAVTIIGDPGCVRHLGYPVVSDLVARCGPLGGLFTALTVTLNEWNLVIACDMPGIRRDDLKRLVELAEQRHGQCVVPRDQEGNLHPLCAVYHRECLSKVAQAIEHKRLKMKDIVLDLQPAFTSLIDTSRLANVNTPEDWTRFSNGW